MSCIDCNDTPNCVEKYSGACVMYTGEDIACLEILNGATYNETIVTFANELCELKEQYSLNFNSIEVLQEQITNIVNTVDSSLLPDISCLLSSGEGCCDEIDFVSQAFQVTSSRSGLQMDISYNPYSIFALGSVGSSFGFVFKINDSDGNLVYTSSNFTNNQQTATINSQTGLIFYAEYTYTCSTGDTVIVRGSTSVPAGEFPSTKFSIAMECSGLQGASTTGSLIGDINIITQQLCALRSLVGENSITLDRGIDPCGILTVGSDLSLESVLSDVLQEVCDLKEEVNILTLRLDELTSQTLPVCSELYKSISLTISGTMLVFSIDVETTFNGTLCDVEVLLINSGLPSINITEANFQGQVGGVRTYAVNNQGYVLGDLVAATSNFTCCNPVTETLIII